MIAATRRWRRLYQQVLEPLTGPNESALTRIALPKIDGFMAVAVYASTEKRVSGGLRQMRANRSETALTATAIEEADIRSAEICGASTQPSEWNNAPAATGIASALYTVAQAKFSFILRTLARLSRTACATSAGSDFINTTPADCMATSVPAPIAIPISACARAGASLTPSPTIAVTCPSRCRRWI